MLLDLIMCTLTRFFRKLFFQTWNDKDICDCFNITHASKKYNLNSKYNTTLLLLFSLQKAETTGEAMEE